MITIDTGKDQKDLDESFNLAYNVFSKNVNQLDRALKLITWTDYPYFEFRNLVIAKDNDNIIGLVRIVPTIFLWNSREVKSAGVSSVCIDERYRGRGISKLLLEKTFFEIEKRKFDLSHLIARKALDNYYNKFGYFGASSYQKIQIKNSNFQKQENVKLEKKFIEQNIKIYSQAYDESYVKCFGRVKRDEKYWYYLKLRFEKMNEVTFFTIKLNNIPIGYMLREGNKILELSILEQHLSNEILEQIIFSNEDEVVLEIPFEHSLVSYLGNWDIIFLSRKCLFGGHMLKIINNTLFKDDDFSIGLRKEFSSSPFFNISCSDHC